MLVIFYMMAVGYVSTVPICRNVRKILDLEERNDLIFWAVILLAQILIIFTKHSHEMIFLEKRPNSTLPKLKYVYQSDSPL